jgi:hypothetical protein
MNTPPSNEATLVFGGRWRCKTKVPLSAAATIAPSTIPKFMTEVISAKTDACRLAARLPDQ